MMCGEVHVKISSTWLYRLMFLLPNTYGVIIKNAKVFPLACAFIKESLELEKISSNKIFKFFKFFRFLGRHFRFRFLFYFFFYFVHVNR